MDLPRHRRMNLQVPRESCDDIGGRRNGFDREFGMFSRGIRLGMVYIRSFFRALAVDGHRAH